MAPDRLAAATAIWTLAAGGGNGLPACLSRNTGIEH
jgi:hypothetical protein